MNLSWDDLLKSTLALLVGAGGMGGLWRYLSSRRSRSQDQASVTTAQALFADALTAQATTFMDGLQRVIDRHEKTIKELEERVDELERDNRRCHNENNQLRQMLASLMRLLRAAGIDLPPDLSVAAIIETETPEGSITALTTVTKRRRGKTQ
jgi:chromosome segregation ATPase